MKFILTLSKTFEGSGKKRDIVKFARILKKQTDFDIKAFSLLTPKK